MSLLSFTYWIPITIVFLVSLTYSQQTREPRRIPENYSQLKESTTEESQSDDVFAIPIDDFRALDYWYGRRLKKRSLLSIDENEPQNRDSGNIWGVKRKYTDIFQLPKGFNPNGGKRSDDKEGRKRTTKTFKNWAGKRSGRPFVVWGGKRGANTFKSWGGKRSSQSDINQYSNDLIPNTQISNYN